MRCSLRRIVPIILLAVPLLLTGCQVPLPYVPPAIMEAVSAASESAEGTPAAQQTPETIEITIDDAEVAEPSADEDDTTVAMDDRA